MRLIFLKARRDASLEAFEKISDASNARLIYSLAALEVLDNTCETEGIRLSACFLRLAIFGKLSRKKTITREECPCVSG